MADAFTLAVLRARMDEIVEEGTPRRAPSKTDAGKTKTKDEHGHAASQFDAEDAQQAFLKIVAWANVQERSCAQIRAKLRQKGYSESAINQSVDKACRLGIIDDTRFARFLVRCRINQGKGLPGIKRELLSNQIDPSALAGFPEDYYPNPDAPESEEQRALRLLARKPPRAKNQLAAAYRKLVQNGYSSDTASRAARQWYSDQL